MKLVKQAGILLVALAVTFGWNLSSFASEDSLSAPGFKDDMIGGLADGLIGTTVLALTGKSGQDMEYLAYGATGGAAAAGAHGLFRTQKSLFAIQGDTVNIDVPLIIPDIQENGTRGTTIIIMAELISGKF
ncbi:MAG: hypothetical protein EG828_00820 [Deltaproteobacteria bacterium]|nr:hypothetical protein [Deltaproteobacteria bacterium]